MDDKTLFPTSAGPLICTRFPLPLASKRSSSDGNHMVLTPTTFSAAPWMIGRVQCFTSRAALLPPGALGSTQRKVKVSPRDWTRFFAPSFKFRMRGFNRLQFSCDRKGRCARVRFALQPIFLHRENSSRVEVPLMISQFLQTGQYRINRVSVVIDSKQSGQILGSACCGDLVAIHA